MTRFSKRNDRKPRYGGKSSAPKAIRRPKSHGRKSSKDGDTTLIRLQKVLASAGIGSRRHCEEIIVEGRVDVDGETVTELGTRVDPYRQEIIVDGERLKPRKQAKRLYFLINKPVGVISTNYDPTGRARVIDFVPNHQRLFTIGRLDKSSDGLILATNDGELTDLLTHPRYGVEKTYLAEVAGAPSPESLEKLRKGVHLAEGFAHAKRVHVRRSHKHSTVMEIVLDEGRNREVRRLLARIGHKVMKLRRIAIGPLRLGTLKAGESRPLRADEVEELYRVARAGRKISKSKATQPEPDRGTSRVPKVEGSPISQPLIDQSVPATISDDDLLLFSDRPTDSDELADIEDDTIEAKVSSFDDAEFASIDLSPISPSDLSKRKNRHSTLIGANSQKGKAPRERGGRGRKFRNKRGRG